MALSTSTMKLPPVRNDRDQVAGLDAENGLVRIVFHEIPIPGKGADRWETWMCGDGARLLGEQLLAAAAGQDAYERPAVRIDIDRGWVKDIIKEHLLRHFAKKQ
jgi:hypothetical protein